VHDELTGFIVERLSRGCSEQDITLEVCERAGLSWQQASSLVFSASVYRAREIARWQLALFLLLGALTILGGSALIVSFIAAVVRPVHDLARNGFSTETIESVGLLAWMIANPQSAGQLVLGAGMIAGGIIGLTAAVRRAI